MSESVPIRETIETIEVVFLSAIALVAILLNSLVLTRILTTSRAPTVRTSFSTGPYQLNSFTLFKLNLCITDFVILLIYTLGKIVWLITFQWRFGDYGCRIYKLLSAFSFYANSNIVVAIGLDRLKVVYTKHIQGATSVRRVRVLLSLSWGLAFLFAIPQWIIFREFDVDGQGWKQCVTIFQMHRHLNTTTPQLRQMALAYEMFHQAMVFWIPFASIAVSYVLIVMKLLHYSLRPKEPVRYGKSSDSSGTRQEGGKDYLLTAQVTPRCSSVSIIREIKKNSICGNGLQRSQSIPSWRHQLRSRVFRSALLVVLAHVAMWLPYNSISTLMFFNEGMYEYIMSRGGNLLEDLIVVNTLVNPLLYSTHSHKKR